ncbi:FecCD family ABC transporter permease [Streptosporangium sp. DT93]|uniref:FecCD family ABC transporter permease n=1 Tax=Streptosporangium sp. DT93 TaxID=3393428 RepID=UPI003CF46204
MASERSVTELSFASHERHVRRSSEDTAAARAWLTRVLAQPALEAVDVAAGEETAISLGVNVHRLRLTLFVLTSLLVGVMVATSGAIAFVGLIVPHAARLLAGADHRRVLPVTALLGAVFLQLADIAARTVNAPQELALSIVTALFGVPCFLWLLRRRSADRAVNLT